MQELGRAVAGTIFAGTVWTRTVLARTARIRVALAGTTLAATAFAGFLGSLPGPAQAELKDYQIARLIMLKSDCQLIELAREVKADRSAVFSGQCSNASHYPDGIVVLCPDIDNNDERSCRIATEAKTFDSLNLLQREDE